MTTLKYGDTAGMEVSERIAKSVASLTVLKAAGLDQRTAYQVVHVQADNSLWYYHPTCALTDDGVLVTVPTVQASSVGAWLLMPGLRRLRLPITYATADAAALLTLQAGMVLDIHDFYWRITADFTGGSSSAIGVSSAAKSGVTTKGDLLGGATGDVLATLVASVGRTYGTIGTKWDTIARRRALWVSADALRFDRITSAFTAGVGAVEVIANVLNNDGA